MLRHTTDELLTAVRRAAYLPPAGGLEDEEILDYINDERQTSTSEFMQRASPSYWRDYHDFTLVSGQSEYRIPDRAVMNTVEQVLYIDPSTGLQQPVNELEPDDRWVFSVGAGSPHWEGQFAHIVEGEHLRLMPTPTATHNGKTLRVYYRRRPSLMVKTAYACAILSVDTVTKFIVTIGASVGADWKKDALVDFVRGDGMFGPIAMDAILAGAPAAGLVEIQSATVDTDEISNFGNNYGGRRQDYVCLAGETVFPEVPRDAWPLLVTAGAARCTLAQKDFDHYDILLRTMGRYGQAVAYQAEPRSQEPDIIFNRNSMLRRGRNR